MKRSIKNKIGFSLLLLSIISPTVVQSQSEKNNTFTFTEFQKDKAFQPVVAVESWLTYTMNAGNEDADYTNRASASFHRLRFGAKGSPYSWLSYAIEFSLDRLGEDPYSAVRGSYNGLDIWKALVTAKLSKNDLLHLHAGYYWAAISLDYTTSPWAVSSFDKPRSDWYLRNFMTGKGNGIETGIGLGGLKNFDGFGINYQLGAFAPSAFHGTEHANPLLTGRVMFSFGDPEQKTYKIRHSGNHWNSRNSLTIGFGGATIGEVDNGSNIAFDRANAYGADISATKGGFKVEAEYYKMNREYSGSPDFEGTEWFVRLGYNIPFKGTFVEPSVSYDHYEGEGESSLFRFIGDDATFDAGVNWYLNRDKLKLSLHYLNQHGSISENLGDFIGMALQVRL